jgi:hypothetical protein
MRAFSTHILGAALVLAAGGLSSSALGADSGSAVVRSIYGDQATGAIARTLGIRNSLDEGHLAVVEFRGGDWALAYVPRTANVVTKDAIELSEVEMQPSEGLHSVVVVKMLIRMTPKTTTASIRVPRSLE